MLCFAFLTLVHVSPFVSPCFAFHHSRCDPVLTVFASRCLHVSRYALTACAMWSRGSWLGGSLVSAWYFVASLTRWYGLVVWAFFVLFVALPYHTEMIQGYHLLHQLTHFTQELEPVTLLSCLCGLFFWFAWFCVFVFLCCCVLFVFGVLVLFRFVLWWWHCDSTQDYVSVLHQFTFEATQPQTAYVCHN